MNSNDKTERAAIQPAEAVAEYQFRTRADWQKNWTGWLQCSAENYADYIRAPLVNDWHYEVRKLYTAPVAAIQPAGDSTKWSVLELDIEREMTVAELRVALQAILDRANNGGEIQKIAQDALNALKGQS